MHSHLNVFNPWPKLQRRHELDRYALISRLPPGPKPPEPLDPREYRRGRSSLWAQSVTIASIDEEAVRRHRGQPLPDEAPRDEFFAQLRNRHASAGPLVHHDHRADRKRGDHRIVGRHIKDEEPHSHMKRPPQSLDQESIAAMDCPFSGAGRLDGLN